MITQSDAAHKQAMMQSMQDTIHGATTQDPATTTPTLAQPEPAIAPLQQAPTSNNTDTPHPTFNPYPSSIHQRVIGSAPHDVTPPATTPASPQNQQQSQPQASSEEPVSPDIIRLANNNDLSISTIAREAERIQKRHLDEEEVVVSLR
jgi:hypothetical protein